MTTPDGRYIIVDGVPWRASDPSLDPEHRQELVNELMSARRAIRGAQGDALQAARDRVHAAKVALGERGEVWWDDEARDYTRFKVENTPYADWWATQAE